MTTIQTDTEPFHEISFKTLFLVLWFVTVKMVVMQTTPRLFLHCLTLYLSHHQVWKSSLILLAYHWTVLRPCFSVMSQSSLLLVAFILSGWTIAAIELALLAMQLGDSAMELGSTACMNTMTRVQKECRWSVCNKYQCTYLSKVLCSPCFMNWT